MNGLIKAYSNDLIWTPNDKCRAYEMTWSNAIWYDMT